MLSGCAVEPFHPDYMQDKINLTIEFKEDIKLNGKPKSGLAYPSGKDCYIIIKEIKKIYSPYEWCIWGHELGHCIFGYFHDKNEGLTC